MPVLVVVIVNVFAPVFIIPLVILIVGTEILFCNVTTVVDALLFTVKTLNVVAPEIYVLDAPASVIVLVAGVNVPPFIQ